MCHTENNFLYPFISSSSQHRIQTRNHAFATFQTESFLPDEFSIQEFFEDYTIIQFVQNAFLLFKRKFFLHESLKMCFHPVISIGIVDISVLNTNRTGVNFT
ncbi:hypothetical protein D3C80_1493940 [compost metagenome]